MEPTRRSFFTLPKVILLLVVVVLAAGLLGWQLGRDDPPPQPTTTPTPAATNDVTDGDVKALISYDLPDGWQEASCPSQSATYIIPSGANEVDCNADPSAPIKLSVDPGNTKDCNELQNVTNVKKHICASEFINNNRTLNATTEHLASSNQPEVAIHAYYIDIGSQVIKAEYVYSGTKQYERGFDELVKSIQKR